MKSSDFSFFDKQEYLRDLTRRISKTEAGDRVLVAAMTFNPEEPLVQELMEALQAAAHRGVAASLAVDAHVLLVKRRSRGGGAPISPATITAALKTFQDAGGQYAITNRPDRSFTNPFGGRSHIKTAIVNDEVYIGGCNLDDITDVDIMVHWRDAASADWLYNLMHELIRQQNTRLAFGREDKELALDARTKLLIDAGERRQSTIYKNALELIDSAEQWVVITCQFFPNSVTARRLAAAHKRGVKVSIYFNHPSKHHRPHNILHHMVLLHERSRRPSVLFKDQLSTDLPFLHAKLIATDQGAIIGSHNYVTAGLNFGTAEIALIRHDPDFSHQALAAFTKQLNV